MKETIYPQMKIIETKDFILRPAKLSDAQDMFEYYKEPAVVKYLPFKSHKTIEDTTKFIYDFFIKNYNNGKVGHLAIVSKENNKVIGNIGLNNVSIGDTKAEIGICINPRYWGNDIATKLTVNSLKYGFDYLKLENLIAVTYADNKYTRKSLEKLGFKYVRSYNKIIFKGINFTNVICHEFRLSKEDYIANKAMQIYEKIENK